MQYYSTGHSIKCNVASFLNDNSGSEQLALPTHNCNFKTDTYSSVGLYIDINEGKPYLSHSLALLSYQHELTTPFFSLFSVILHYGPDVMPRVNS
jgi:hypothetical protein